ncbi:glycoside hydrolase family 38 N-terminal domain-containing protein [Nonomuraea angiospora]|uniref:glycoside hydrolase family 38 N-terminal domain-containing protein n=1 Tax=Nonomuraea angiospora TaxID=46172 RepID=UPI0029B35BE3|nr:glycoside hydrolase family 38 C-terminal domain-containing protein [Nonomuraea angiospora]MDX3105380.1 glycoside hydrolase family 38 C-terminal domain-containing protein [Nonomuraea angiospora]
MSEEIVVVPHTHWDREWYEPFQRFRLRLVALLDEVLDTMEREPAYHFTLDGQLACVDDYLEVRPENRDRIAALVESGRLAVGPWQILLDEFLCSGENIVRNLELGMSRADKLGGAMPVGYLPDMFGHTAQMPQILRKAGLLHACVYRGVPSSVTTDAFAWVAPDGTALRTQYLPAGGYGNGAHLFSDSAGLAERAAAFVTTMREWHGPEGALLAMYGTDHSAPVRGLPEMVAAIGARMDTLSGYIGKYSGEVDGLPRVEGELRSHARANILPGVISVRAHVKQAMGRAERMVERYAEPLAALWGAEWPGRFLDMAWWRLVDASGHDSVTGCGVDDTAQQVAARIAEAEHLGQAVRDMVTARLAGSVPSDGVLLVNPTPAARSGVVVVDVAGTDPLVDPSGAPVPVQPLEYAPTLLLDEEMDAATALTFVHGTELYGQHITAWSVEGDTLTFTVARETSAVVDLDDLRAATGGVRRVRILAEPRRTVAALVEVPPLGHTSIRPAPREQVRRPPAGQGRPVPAPVRGDEETLDNGLLRVTIAGDGTLTLVGADGTTVTGAGRIVDGGDVGDTYNHAPPAGDLLVSEPSSVETELVCSGPLVAAVDVRRTYRWPASGRGIDGTPELPAPARSRRTEEIVVTTRVELRAGEPYVRLRVEFDNRCEDHRVRLHVPLPAPATESHAEGQFAVVTRGLTSEGGCGETPLPTFPASSWVAAAGVAALLEHVTEYEVADGELALTLLRSVGYLSRNRNALRPEPAGPQLPTPAAQSRGIRSVSLALMPYADSWQEVVPQAETFRHDLLVVPGQGERASALPDPASGLSVTGDGVVMTSLRMRDDRRELRVVALTPAATEAVIEGAFTQARHADLRGRPGDPLPVADGVLRLALKPWEIATVQLSG